MIVLASLALRRVVKRLDLIAFGRFRYAESAAIVGVFVAMTSGGGDVPKGYEEVVGELFGRAPRIAVPTANRMLSAWRQVMREAWRLGDLDADTYRRVVDVSNIRGTSEPRGRWLTDAEKLALIEACVKDPTVCGARDAAMLAVALLCGLRRYSLVALDLGHVDMAADTLHVSGKGGKLTAKPIGGAREWLVSWLDVRGGAAGPLFTPTRRGRLVRDRRMSPDAVYQIVKRRAASAGVERLSPHSLRKTMASDMLADGADLLTVQRLLDHVDPKTTAVYDLRDERERRKAQGRLRLPSRQR